MKLYHWLIIPLMLFFTTSCGEDNEIKPVTMVDKYWIQVSIYTADGINILSEEDGGGLSSHKLKYEYNGVCNDIGPIFIDKPWNFCVPLFLCKWYGAGIVANEFSDVDDLNREDDPYGWSEWFKIQHNSIFIGEWTCFSEDSDIIKLYVDDCQFEIVSKMIGDGLHPTQHIYVNNELYSNDDSKPYQHIILTLPQK